MVPVTLTAEEFRTIHNALCDLDSIKNALEDVVHPNLYKKLATVITDIRKKGLRGAYDQESEIFNRNRIHYSNVRKEYNLRNEWSIYEINDLFQQHSFPGATRVRYLSDDGELFADIEGNTWVDLYCAADKIVREHYTFIEGFHPRKKDPQTLDIVVGS